VTATLPDGKTKTLLSISDWDFAWQEQYQFQDFVDLPKGTKLHVRITYDNSADNPRNPTNPPKQVRWGRESTDEMGSVTLQVVAAKEDDFPKLQEGYRQHIRDALANGPLKAAPRQGITSSREDREFSLCLHGCKCWKLRQLQRCRSGA